MEQSKIESLLESTINIFIGYIVVIESQLLIFPLFNIHVSITDNLLIGGYFSIINMIRSYLIRCYFNAKLRNTLNNLLLNHEKV